MRAPLLFVAALGLLPYLTLARQAAPPVSPVLLVSAGAGTGTLLGAWDGRRWLRVPGAVPLIRAGAAYSVQGLSTPARRVLGGQPESFGEPCADSYSVSLRGVQASEPEIAVAAGLLARPRPVTVLPTRSPAYEAVVRAELQRRGLKRPVLQLRSVTRADLDGDGHDEVIIEATRQAASGAGQLDPAPEARPGDYSLLLLRWTAGGQARTAVLGADVVLRSGTPDAPRNGLRFRLEGIADLNGDGRMELITSESYYEGDTDYALTWTPTQGLKEVLATGCGV